jgi:hypothetical protein
MASVVNSTIEPDFGASSPARRAVTVTPSLRATLAEGLSRLLACEHGGSAEAVCLFAVSVATLSWAVDKLRPVVQEASPYLIGWLSGGAPAHPFC